MALLEIYHYGDCGKLDDDNPFKLFQEEHVKDILYYIGKSEANSLGINELSDLLDISYERLSVLIRKIEKLNLVYENQGYYTVGFTMIFEKDLDQIDVFSKAMAQDISEAIVAVKDKIHDITSRLKSAKYHSMNELLYHVIGSYILDGLAIDTFSKKGLFKTSKVQKDNRDYILFGFEKSDKVDQFSENILCSCNNCRTEQLSFVSFGDAAGDRNDFYRFNRKVLAQINSMKARKETKASYLDILEKNNQDMINRCSMIAKDIIENNNDYTKLKPEDDMYAQYLLSLSYIKEHTGSYKVSVPIFYPEDMTYINAIHDLLIDIMYPILKDSFEQAEKSLKISALDHGVDIKEVLNEMWHQVFGNINEELVRSGIFKEPNYFEDEGRYLKAVFIHN